MTLSYALLDSRNLRDLNGDKALPFTDRLVTNNSTVANTTPPFLAGAEVEASGTTLTLTFNEALGNGVGTLPPKTAFTVEADGADVPVQTVAAGTGTEEFILNLTAGGIKEGQTVTVSYGVPATNPLQDVDDNTTVAFTNSPVVNHSAVDATPPGLAGAEVLRTGNTLTLTFNEDLDNGSGKLPPASAFMVKADGADVTVQSVAVGAGTDDFILNLEAEAIKTVQVVTVSYTVPTSTSDHAIQDTAGNKAEAFTDESVTNNSTAIFDLIPPELASAEAPASGATLTLTFDEDLDNGVGKLPPASAFTVKANGVVVTVQSVTVGAGIRTISS